MIGLTRTARTRAGVLLAVVVAASGATGAGGRTAATIRPGHGSVAGSGSIVGTIVADGNRSGLARRARTGEYPELNENEVEHEQALPKVALHLTGPGAPATSEAPARGKSVAARAAGDGFTIFRQTVVPTAASQSSEPTVANDRNGVIATGNTWALVSGDDGLTFPQNLNPFGNESYGGFCCDQIAYAVDRGGYSLVFWLRQYRYCGDGDSRDTCVGGGNLDEDTLKLRVYRGRDDLLDGSDSCEWSFQPQENFKFGRKLWFDFNHISNTSKYLYLTTNVRDETTGTDGTRSDGERVGGLIWRLGLDDIDDGNCQIHYDYWYRDGDIYLTPVQNAGSTMYIGTTRAAGLEGRKLRIYSIADGSSTLDDTKKNVANFESDGYKCPLPDGTNGICADMHAGRTSGFRSGDTVGWMWTAAQGHGFPFPYVQVAVFRTGSLKKVAEHEIWSSDFAWMYGYAGVNARGDLGVILYALGGGRFPKAQAFLRTDPTNWDGITMHAIAASDGGATGWGHYAQVLKYGDCPNTFLGMAWVMAGGQPSDRMVWFGDEKDGCPDVTVTGVGAGIGAPFDSGETMHAFATVRNWGSSTAPASKLAYYLSRDQVKDDRDTRLARAPIDALAAGASHLDTTDLVTPSFIGGRAGTYYLLACADDTGLFDEISDSNNCRSSLAFEVNPATAQADENYSALALETVSGTGAHRVKAGTSLSVRDTIDVSGRAPARRRPAIVYELSRAPGPDDDRVGLPASTVTSVRASGPRRVVLTHRIAVPRDVPPGRWYLRACLRHGADGDAVAADDCRSLALTIDSAPTTVGPRRAGPRP